MTHEGYDGHEKQMSLAQILAPLSREKTFIMIFCLTAMVTSLALTYVASEKYLAGIAIFYQPKEGPATKVIGTQSFGAPMPAPPFRVISRTLQDVARSEAIVRPVVTELGLDKEIREYTGPWYERWYRMTKDFAIDWIKKLWIILKHGRLIEEDKTVSALKRLHNDIAVDSTDSYVFILSVRDKRPYRAAITADAVGEKLVQWLLDRERQPGEKKLSQLEELIDAKRQELDRLREQIQALLAKNRTASIELEIERDMDRLSAFELTRVDIEGQIAQSRNEIGELRGKLQTKDRSSRDALEHLNPGIYRELASSQAFTEVKLTGLEARQRAIESSIAELRKRLRDLPAAQTTLDDLKIKLESTERDYTSLREDYQEATVQSTVLLSEAQLLHKAIPPSFPVTPIKIYHVGLATVLALMLSVGIVYVAAFFDLRILAPPTEGEAGP